MPQYAVTATFGNRERSVQKRFSVLLKQRAKPRNNFWRVAVYNSMRYAICIRLNAKDLAIDFMMLAYGNRPNAIKFARANNSDLLQALKHLMETRLSTKLLSFEFYS